MAAHERRNVLLQAAVQGVFLNVDGRGYFQRDTTQKCEQQSQKGWSAQTEVCATVAGVNRSGTSVFQIALQSDRSADRRAASAIPVAVWCEESPGCASPATLLMSLMS